MKTHIINKTEQSFELKEGNAGVYRLLKQLDPGVKFSIKVDPNATYREYMVATGKKGETVFLTSDHLIKYEVIDIREVPGEDPGTVIYVSVPSNPRQDSSWVSEASNVGGAGETREVVVDINSDDDNEEIISRKQVMNLLKIGCSAQHRCALEYWSRQADATTLRQDSKSTEIRAVNNETFQLVGFYSVFQGVLLTVVSQSNLLHCNNSWSVLSLSALASFVTLIGILQKFRFVWELERTIEDEQGTRQIYATRVQRLLREGVRFKFHVGARDGGKKRTKNWEFTGSILGVIVVLLVFSVTFLASIQRILCHPGKANFSGR